MTDVNFLTDHFLIAMPALRDPSFFHSVTYVCEHTAEGALGLIINRPSSVTLGELFEQLGMACDDPAIRSRPVYVGGPVQRERGFVLHSPVGDWQGSLPVTEHIGLTTSPDIMEALAAGEGPEHCIITLGYAGWGEGQLEAEILANSWLFTPADADIMFKTPAERRWQAAAELVGVDITLLSNDAGHA